MTPLPEAFMARPLAHRALHDLSKGRPENSRAAIRAAIAAGYGIEIDVQMSADGMAFVFHDDALERLTSERGPVRDRTSLELQHIQLKGGSETVPPLGEVLALVAGVVPVLIEIKDQDGAMGPNVGALEAAVARTLVGYDGTVAVMSFNPHSVAAFGAQAPEIPRGLVTSAYDPGAWAPLPPEVCARLRGIPDYARIGAQFISHEVLDLDRPRVAELKQAGARVLCWTVRSEDEERAARQVAENITFEGYAARIPA